MPTQISSLDVTKEKIAALRTEAAEAGTWPWSDTATWLNYERGFTAQAKPERPHARVADPSRVDGVRPWTGPRISADGSGLVPGLSAGERSLDRSNARFNRHSTDNSAS